MDRIGLQSIVFAFSLKAMAERIAELINHLLDKNSCRICCNEQMLISTHQQTPACSRISILLAADQKELDIMVELMPLFLDDLAVLLMVPDHRHSTIAKAHLLRPRYLMGPDFNYSEFRSVLTGILNYHLHKNRPNHY